MEINLKNKKALANTNKLFNGRNDSTKFLDDDTSMILEATRKAAEEQRQPEPPKAKTKRKKMSIRIAWRIYKWN